MIGRKVPRGRTVAVLMALAMCLSLFFVMPLCNTANAATAPPVLTADTTNDLTGYKELVITLTPDDPAWREAITQITANGTTIAARYYRTDDVGKIVMVTNTAISKSNDYQLVIKADGYEDATVTQTVNALYIYGAGVTNPLKISLPELNKMDQFRQIYGTINTYPTKKWYVGEGVKLRDLLKEAGMKDTATILSFISTDTFTANLTVDDLLNNKTYYFPYLKDNNEYAGYIPGSPDDAEEVEPMLALRSANSDDFDYMNSSESILLLFGQRGVSDQTNDAFVKYVNRIEVLTDVPDTCDAPTADVEPGEVAEGTKVRLNSEDTNTSKIYYTTDGTEPTVTSSMIYNWIADRWKINYADPEAINKPIEITDDTTIKAVTIGHGRKNSEVVTFTYTVPKFTVTFDANGGTPTPEMQRVRAGDKVTKPEDDPTKDGYIFTGWYSDAGSTTAWDFDNDTVSENTVLCANWIEVLPLTVQPATIVQDHLSYIHVQYDEGALNDADFALLDENSEVIGNAVKGADGKAVIIVTAPSVPGVYKVAALLEGERPAEGIIEVVAYNSNIWEAYATTNGDGYVVINFNENIADKAYSVSVNGAAGAAAGRFEDGNTIVTDIEYSSLQEGETTVLSVSGVKYPRLYPSYTFTFTAIVAK